MEIDAIIVVAFIGLAGSLFASFVSLSMSRDKFTKSDAIKLEVRLTKIEHDIINKLNPIWDTIIREIPKILISPNTPKLDELIIKTMEDVELLTKDEIVQTIQGIERKYLTTKDTGKILTAMFLLNILKKRLGKLNESA